MPNLRVDRAARFLRDKKFVYRADSWKQKQLNELFGGAKFTIRLCLVLKTTHRQSDSEFERVLYRRVPILRAFCRASFRRERTVR